VNYTKHTHVSKEDFDRYFNDFDRMAKFMTEFNIQTPIATKDGRLHYDPSDPGLLSDFDENVSFDLNESERESIQNIAKVFSDGEAKFNEISSNEDYFYFREIMIERDNELFSIIYSRNGKIPEFITGLTPYEYVYDIEEVRDDWYFLSAIPRKGVEPFGEE
jgi:hypothetical protein